MSNIMTRALALEVLRDFVDPPDGGVRPAQDLARAAVEFLQRNRRVADLEAKLAAGNDAMEAFAKVYTELHGVQAEDDRDGSPNWWMFFNDAVEAIKVINKELVSRREKLAAAERDLKEHLDANKPGIHIEEEPCLLCIAERERDEALDGCISAMWVGEVRFGTNALATSIRSKLIKILEPYLDREDVKKALGLATEGEGDG